MHQVDWHLKFEDLDYKKVRREDFGEYDVSTVWLGLDHSFGEGPPLIFETMVFGGEDDFRYYQVRYATEEEAIEGHEEAIKKVLEAIRLFT